jgi:hypothetical protein
MPKKKIKREVKVDDKLDYPEIFGEDLDGCKLVKCRLCEMLHFEPSVHHVYCIGKGS